MKKGNCIYSFFMCINIKLSFFCYDIFIIMFYFCIVNIYDDILYICFVSCLFIWYLYNNFYYC